MMVADENDELERKRIEVGISRGDDQKVHVTLRVWNLTEEEGEWISKLIVDAPETAVSLKQMTIERDILLGIVERALEKNKKEEGSVLVNRILAEGIAQCQSKEERVECVKRAFENIEVK